MKKIAIATGLLIASTLTLSAVSLQEIVAHVLDTNPIVNERLANYKATKAEIGIADAEYYPTLDLKSSYGRQVTGELNKNATSQTFNIFQNSLVLKQNIFNGYATHERVDYYKMRTLAAAYSYLEKVNDVALQTVVAYTDLLKEQEILNNSDINVQHNEVIYGKVLKAYQAGLSSLSEVSKISASLSLARSNRAVQKNRLRNVYTTFRRVVGRIVPLSELNRDVRFDLNLPKTQEHAQLYALEYNPSLLVAEYNIKGHESLYRESQSKFYPTVDVQVSQNYNENYNQQLGVDDGTQAFLTLSYNLYNGGADEAKRKNLVSKMNQEVEVTNDLRRQVIEGMDLSWNAYALSKAQVPLLQSYKNQSQEALELYTKEYEMGERSMLDLIAAENDLKRANDEIIIAKYDLLVSKYRIMDAMGLTVASLLGSEEKFYHRVGIYTPNTKGTNASDSYVALQKALKHEDKKEQTVPVRLDADADRISDTKDISPDTLPNSDVLYSGETTASKSYKRGL